MLAVLGQRPILTFGFGATTRSATHARIFQYIMASPSADPRPVTPDAKEDGECDERLDDLNDLDDMDVDFNTPVMVDKQVGSDEPRVDTATVAVNTPLPTTANAARNGNSAPVVRTFAEAASNDWLRNAKAAASDVPKFLSNYPEPKDLERAAKQFKFQVGMICTAANVPERHRNFVAFIMLGGDAYDLACDLPRDGETLPSYDAIMALVDSLVTGSALGDLSKLERLQQFSYISTARKHFLKNHELPDINYIVQQHKRAFMEMSAPISEVSKCVMILQAIGFKALTSEIRRVANEKGYLVEVVDSEQMFTCLLAHNNLWIESLKDKFVAEGVMTSSGKPNVHWSGEQKSGNTAGSSGWHKQKPVKQHQAQQQSPRPFKPTSGFNPFKVYNGQCTPKPEGKSTQLWVNVPAHVRKQRITKSLCIACGKGKHTVKDCHKAAAMFAAKDLCYHPPKK